MYLSVVFCDPIEDRAVCAVDIAALFPRLCVLSAFVSVAHALGAKVVCVAKGFVYAFQVSARHEDLLIVSNVSPLVSRYAYPLKGRRAGPRVRRTEYGFL